MAALHNDAVNRPDALAGGCCRARRTQVQRCLGVGVLLVAVLFTGCQTVKVEQPMPATMLSNDVDAQMDFWHSLTEQPLTCNDEAFHGLLLYFDGDDPAENYEQRVELMRDRGMLPAGFDGAADDAAMRGIVAVAIVKGLKLRGGVVMSLFGLSPRYATRELTYRYIYPPSSSPQQVFSGTEFVGIIGRIEDFERLNPPPEASPKVEPDEPAQLEQQQGVEQRQAEPNVDVPADPA